MITRAQLEQILRYIVPRNLENYTNVFIHKSYIRVSKDANLSSNERLEYLGDSILNLIIGEYLYDRFDTKNEGFLTKIRIKLVNGKTLAMLSRKLNIDRHMVIAFNTKVNDKILEDALEALIGAIYLDYRETNMGLHFARHFIVSLINDEIDFDQLMFDTNFKDILLRFTQSKGLKSPVYNVIDIKGKAHEPIFMLQAEVDVDGQLYKTSSNGKTKRECEQACAKEILDKLGINSEQILI